MSDVRRWKAICTFIVDGTDAWIPCATMVEANEGFVSGADYDAIAAKYGKLAPVAIELRGERDALAAELAAVKKDLAHWKDCHGVTADELAAVKAWNRQMVEKAASGGTLDGYRELGQKCAALEARLEVAETLNTAECKHSALIRARLAKAKRALRDICRVDKAAPGRKDCYIWADMLAIASGYFRDENGLYPDDAARAADSAPAVRPCTCDPADSPPVPCPRKYALAECRAAGRVDAESFKMEVLACAGDTWECPRCGHSEPWWTESNADYATRTAVTPDEVQK